MKKKIIKSLMLLSLNIPIANFASTVRGGGCTQINYPSLPSSGMIGIINNNSALHYMLDVCQIDAKTKNIDLIKQCPAQSINFKQLAYNNTIILSGYKPFTTKPITTIKITIIDVFNMKRILFDSTAQSNKTSQIILDLNQLMISPPLLTLNPNKIEKAKFKIVDHIKQNPLKELLPNFGVLDWYLDFTINTDQTVKIDKVRLNLQYTESPDDGCARQTFTYTLTNNDLKKFKIIN